MAELSCESLKNDLRQVVKETLCQELSEVANRVHQAVREEIQNFIERWFSECDIRAPKRCDGHLAGEPRKSWGQNTSQALPSSSATPSALYASLPALTSAPGAGSADCSSASPSMFDRSTEDDKRTQKDDVRPVKRCSKVALLRPEILRDISATSGTLAGAALDSVAPSSSSSDLQRKEIDTSSECRGLQSKDQVGCTGQAQPEKAAYAVSSTYAPTAVPDEILEKIKEADADVPGKLKERPRKEDRKISFSDFNEPPEKKLPGKPRSILHSLEERSSKQQGREAAYRDMSKVVPLPEDPAEDEYRTLGSTVKMSVIDQDVGTDSRTSTSQDREFAGETTDNDWSDSDIENMEDRPQWVMDIRKTIKHCTTQMITERKRCRPPEWWIKAVESAWFDYFATSFVILNAITIGIQADWSVRNLHLHESPPAFFNITEKVFCIVFTVELLMRISIHGILFFSVAGWKWNVFDTVVVSLQLVEEIVHILSLLTGNEDSEGGFDTSNFNFVRVLRVLRLLRVFRIVRIVRFVSELRTMVSSIANSMRSLIWTVILIFLMIYVVGVYLTQLVSDHGAEHPEDMQQASPLREKFGSLGVSILSLFQAMTGGVDWEDLVNPLMEEITPLLGLLFTVYIAFAILAMMNVVTAVFIETALQNANKDKDTDTQTCLRKFISAEDGQDDITDETMTWEDFKQRLRNPTKKGYFRALDLEIAEAKGLFQLLDTEGDGIIQVEEFISWFLQLRGPAKAIDLATVMYNQKRLTTDWAKHAQLVEETLLDILNTLPGKLGRALRMSHSTSADRRTSVQSATPISCIRSSGAKWNRTSQERGSKRSVASGKGSISQSK